MKSITGILLIAATLAVSCKSDPAVPISAFSSTPEAKATENAKSGGVYKGVIVGSSGFFSIVLQDGKKEVDLTLDGEKRTLTAVGLASWTSPLPIKNAVFTGGDWSVTFSVGATGLTPSIVLNLTGHPNAQAVILKELSTDVIRAYEGTYAGAESGTWNFIIQGPVLIGANRSTSGSSTVMFNGIVNGTTITLDPPITGTGTIVVDNVSGTWQTDTSTSGTWTGKRVK